MLIRVAGKLSDGRTFASRVDAPNAVGAIEQFRRGLAEAKVEESTVTEIGARPMKGSAIHIGAPKAKKAAPGNKPAPTAASNKR